MAEQLIYARVKPRSRIVTVTAFGGKEYCAKEWRLVPSGVSEKEARHNPHLEIELRDIQPALIEVESAETPEKEQEAQASEEEAVEYKTSIAAQKFADEYSIDLGFITGTGKNGAITIKDVRSYVETDTEAAAEE